MTESDAGLFDYIFNPRSVAIIGASPMDLATLAQMSTKIRDRLFLVNPKYTEVRGKKCYPSISAGEKFPVYPNLDAAIKTLSHLYNFGLRRLSSPFLS